MEASAFGAQLGELAAVVLDGRLDARVGGVVERTVTPAAGVVGEADLEVTAALAASLLALPPLFSSLAQAARARLPASSNAAAFVIRAARKTISSLGGRAGGVEARPDGCTGSAAAVPRVVAGTDGLGLRNANRVTRGRRRLGMD